jgi:uncharacterized membrane protein
MRAELALTSLSALPDGDLDYAIVNTGNAELTCGLAYRLEREAGAQWQAMNDRMIFRAIGFRVPPGDRKQLTARIPPHAPAGRYRITTSVIALPQRDRIELSADFQVD